MPVSRWIGAAVVAASVLNASYASAADNFPNRPIKIVVPYTPGGGVDQLSRVVADRLQRVTGQPVIVENRPGGATNIGSAYVVAAKPDGYTLLMATTPTVVNASLMRKMAFDPLTELAPVTLVATYPTLLVVHPSLPVKSVADLITYAKAHPDALSYASVGAGTSPHLAAELFKRLAGVEMTHIPYNGSAPAAVDLIAGRVQLMFSTMMGGLQYVRQGKLRALAVTTTQRSDAVPDVPTVAESGLNGYEVTGFYGLMAPKGTPAPIIAMLRDAVAKGMLVAGVSDQFRDDGLRIVASSTADFAAMLARENQKWAALIRSAAITAE